jgi:hypothetical protein
MFVATARGGLVATAALRKCSDSGARVRGVGGTLVGDIVTIDGRKETTWAIERDGRSE